MSSGFIGNIINKLHLKYMWNRYWTIFTVLAIDNV